MSKGTYEVASRPAQTIRSIMKAEGVTQKELAKRTGVSRQNVSFLLNKKTSMRYDVFERMVNALGYEIQVIKFEDTSKNMCI